MRWIVLVGLPALFGCDVLLGLDDYGVATSGAGASAGGDGPAGSGTGASDALDCLVELTDGFVDELSSQWSYSADPGVSGAPEDNAFRFTASADLGATADGRIASTLQYDFDDCGVLVEVVPEALPSEAEIRFALSLDGNNNLRWYVNEGQLSINHEVEGTNAYPFDLPYDQTKHRWWLIRGRQGRVQYFTSHDGIEWTLRFEEPKGFSFQSLEVQLAITAEPMLPSFVVKFDNVNLPP